MFAEYFVIHLTQPGDTILDPFCGSGTTLYAAKELRRKAIGCDVSDEACALAEKRLAQDLLPMGVNDGTSRQDDEHTIGAQVACRVV